MGKGEEVLPHWLEKESKMQFNDSQRQALGKGMQYVASAAEKIGLGAAEFGNVNAQVKGQAQSETDDMGFETVAVNSTGIEGLLNPEKSAAVAALVDQITKLAIFVKGGKKALANMIAGVAEGHFALYEMTDSGPQVVRLKTTGSGPKTTITRAANGDPQVWSVSKSKIARTLLPALGADLSKMFVAEYGDDITKPIKVTAGIGQAWTVADADGKPLETPGWVSGAGDALEYMAERAANAAAQPATNPAPTTATADAGTPAPTKPQQARK